MIIYNLKKYLENEFPGESFRIGMDNNDPDRVVYISDFGGTETPWFEYHAKSIQVITRDADTPKAHKLSLDIYDKLNRKFGLILPSNTIDAIVYPQIQTAQLSGNALPGYIGEDDNGRHEFSTNYRLIY